MLSQQIPSHVDFGEIFQPAVVTLILIQKADDARGMNREKALEVCN